MQKAEDFKTKSGDINIRYQNLHGDMDAFIGRFKSFATGKESQIKTGIDSLQKELDALNDEIRDKKTAMLVLGCVSVALLPATAVIAACFAPVAPAIIV